MVLIRLTDLLRKKHSNIATTSDNGLRNESLVASTASAFLGIGLKLSIILDLSCD